MKKSLALISLLFLLTGCTPASSPNEPSSFSADDVAQHADADSCWTIINGKVYDVTRYVGRHEGGDEILRACGIDATSMFESRPEGVDSAGEAHSEDAHRKLEGFYIGDLQ